ncbi:hypothetical protein D3C71_1325090 [compost metagenome]
MYKVDPCLILKLYPELELVSTEPFQRLDPFDVSKSPVIEELTNEESPKRIISSIIESCLPFNISVNKVEFVVPFLLRSTPSAEK